VIAVAALGAGVVSGAFAVFSLLVMPALRALPPAQGVAAMQSIDRTAVRPTFLGLLFGTGLLCVVLGVLELTGDRRPAVISGAALYVAGVAGVTVLGNVPLNDALARWDAEQASESAWHAHVRRWTAWNSVRAVAALASCAALVVGLTS